MRRETGKEERGVRGKRGNSVPLARKQMGTQTVVFVPSLPSLPPLTRHGLPCPPFPHSHPQLCRGVKSEVRSIWGHLGVLSAPIPPVFPLPNPLVPPPLLLLCPSSPVS
ncbi:hypothetical protein E2C01_071049 [Portunus trituberculatus]|uniref:Uncharacterized protein n=1 Tax=Portunus trituberculatus TaxID=210409 RepID=A0A5B7HZ01_PORTR|nr:hypothetical protein [Portunus trituberculatus]